MGAQDPQRRAAQYRMDRLAREEAAAGTDPAGAGDRAHPGDLAEAKALSCAGPDGRPGGPRPPSMAARGAFADELVRQAMARGEFDDLPLTGKPIPGLTGRHDPDWWLKAFIEREGITGVLPEALQLRKDDAALDDILDRESTEDRVRETLAEFNARVVEARRQLLGGPPVVTPTREIGTEVARWRERRRARQADAYRAAEETRARAEADRRGRAAWWRGRRG